VVIEGQKKALTINQGLLIWFGWLHNLTKKMKTSAVITELILFPLMTKRHPRWNLIIKE
jgi:hypothetical protein